MTKEEKNELESEITFAELTVAAQNMKKGKTPGCNGFSSDFFRFFWKTLGIFLYRAFKETCIEGKAMWSHRESLITLIPKPGQTHHLLKNWRPISLLNVDYKIISTAIGNRIKRVIDSIISPSQTAYIRGRCIAENSRIVYDTISHVNQTKTSGVIMAADFEAAFETISWPYLRSVLTEMNFGRNFISLINMMYLNEANFSRILLNGFLGNKIYMHRGIRQGDPVSGYLFDIAVEILSKQLAESRKFKGITIDHTEIRLSQYADDTIIFLDDSNQSLIGITEELSDFSEQTGLKINWEKTACLSLGSHNIPTAPNNNILQKIKWVSELKILGIYFKANLTDITHLNLERKLTIVEKEIAQWNRRYITPIGKIAVIKSLLLSKLVHLFMALPNPSPSYVKKIEQMLFRFLWHNKPDRVKRAKIIQSNHLDGLQMVDLTSFLFSLKLSWIKRLYISSSSWATIAKSRQIDPIDLLSYGVEKLKQIRAMIKNVFWNNVIEALIKFNQLVKLNLEEMLREKIWFSDYTKFKKTIIPEWDKKGLRFIGDLFDPTNGNILSREEIKRQYRISMTFLCHESLIRSLPNEVRNANVTTFQRPNFPFKLQTFNKPNLNKHCYLLFVNEMRHHCLSTNEKIKQKWIRDIGFHQVGSLILLKNTTKEVNLIYLHYRIISRIITINKYLNTIKISPSDACTFCSQTTETMKPCLFWECPATQVFIQSTDRNYTRSIKYISSIIYNHGSFYKKLMNCKLF